MTTTETMHTPGPWIVHTGSDTHGICQADNQDEYIARVHAFAPTDGDMEAQGLANARLIAAAPALLEALESVVALIDADARIGESRYVIKAREAIAAARGEGVAE